MRRLGMKLRQPQQVIGNDLKEGKVFRALYSNRQLEEVLVDFWFNHFNVYETESPGPSAALPATSATRSVRTSWDISRICCWPPRGIPAMLYYLDNWESISPEACLRSDHSPGARGATWRSSCRGRRTG